MTGHCYGQQQGNASIDPSQIVASAIFQFNCRTEAVRAGGRLGFFNYSSREFFCCKAHMHLKQELVLMNVKSRLPYSLTAAALTAVCLLSAYSQDTHFPPSEQ